MVSQNNEEEVILNYFSGKPTGNLISLGENDGITFSNAYALLQKGWSGILIEPSVPCSKKINELYKDREDVKVFQFGIGTKNEIVTFYHPEDSLLSTTDKDSLKRWKHVTSYEEVPTQFYTWDYVLNTFPEFKKSFDFITIDCEGMDWEILQQIDLQKLDCKCLCIEHNKQEGMLEKMKNYCINAGLTKELLRNGENLIMAV